MGERVLAALFCFIAVIGNATGFQFNELLQPSFLIGGPSSRDQESLQMMGGLNKSMIEQHVDHFTPTDTRRWNQVYYHSLKWYKQGGPVFLFLCDLQPPKFDNESTPFLTLAKKYHAAIYHLTLRFSRESKPFPDLKTTNLKYSTTSQSIEDAAKFVSYINDQEKLNTKWIVFGESYTGSLAAWLRQAYPELVYGAVASSARLEPILDYRLNQVIEEQTLAAVDPKCPDAVREGFNEMSRLMWTEDGRKQFSNTFRLLIPLRNTTLRYIDVQVIFSQIVANFQIYNSYPPHSDPGQILRETCERMTNTSKSAMNRIEDVLDYLAFGNDYRMIISYDFLVTIFSATSYNSYPSIRLMLWRACNEFGWMPSTNQGGGMFGSTVPSSLQIGLCSDVFGSQFNAMTIQDKVRDTRRRYGGNRNFKGTNVVFTNGNLDSYHTLGLKNSIHPSVVSILIKGTIAGADMRPPTANDVPDLIRARKITDENIAKWLNVAHKTELDAQTTSSKNRIVTTASLKPFESTVQEKPLQSFKQMTGEMIAYPPGFAAGQITAPLDHFDITNQDTFQQRYWFNPLHYQPGGPIFLFLGSHGAANTEWVTNPHMEMMEIARELRGAVFLLEHRYYGKSTPTPDLSSSNLQWLTSRQALADTARFVMAMNKQHQFYNPRWVTFGGFYSGMLSAWTRLMFPGLIVGAVASSAPIAVKVDSFEILLNVEKSLRISSEECANNVGDAFKQMRKLSMTGVGRVKLSQIFSLSPAWTNASTVTDKDIQNLFRRIQTRFIVPVANNNVNKHPFDKGCGIEDICAIMTNRSRRSVENLAAMNRYVMEQFSYEKFTTTDNDYSDLVARYNDTTSGNTGRCWLYQRCNEFGLFHTTDIGKSIFKNSVPLNFYSEMCPAVFGPNFNSENVDKFVEKTREVYGDNDNFKGTNIMFINGEFDPWRSLSKNDGNGSVTTVVVKGAGQCADLYPPRPKDTADLRKTRERVLNEVTRWIGVSPAPTTTSTAATTTSTAATTTTSKNTRTSAQTTTGAVMTSTATTTKNPKVATTPVKTTTTSSASRMDSFVISSMLIAFAAWITISI